MDHATIPRNSSSFCNVTTSHTTPAALTIPDLMDSLREWSTPTEAEQTGYRNSQSTEPEKAEFHTPAIPNTVRDCVQENSLENVSPDPVQMTLPTSDTYPQASAAAFDSKSEDREEIADTSAPALEKAEEQVTYTPGSRKATRKDFGKPASSFSDFYM